MLGVKPKMGAIAIAGFLAGVSPVMHDFWKQQDPQQRQVEMIQFAKNLALLGGTFALIGIEEPWPVSLPIAQPDRGSEAKLADADFVAKAPPEVVAKEQARVAEYRAAIERLEG